MMTAPHDAKQLIDQATLECDATRDGQPCPQPASWIAHITLTTGDVCHYLYCDEHTGSLARHMASCLDCPHWYALRLERLS